MDLALILILALIGALFLGLALGYPVAFTMPAAALLIGLIAFYLTQAGVDLGTKPSHVPGAPGLPVRFQWATTFGNLHTRIVGIFSESRDILIAVPLFVFMGVILERSGVAEDLLDTMGTLMGPIPGGLGISVVAVGAVLAASTGIVGATVVTMGMVSLPTMLRRGYSKGLSTGIICASGTLGQIIPPSIVLVLLADQLSNAVPQANDIIKQREGVFFLPPDMTVAGATVGDIFQAAILPGLILVGLYMLYTVITAFLRPAAAPRVPAEELDSLLTSGLVVRVLKVLVAPLMLIVVVLGTIFGGIAPTTEAASVGAVGATLLAAQRLLPLERQGWALFGVGFGSMVALLLLRFLGDGTGLYALDFYAPPDSGLDIFMRLVAGGFLLLLILTIAWALKVVYDSRTVSVEDAEFDPGAEASAPKKNTLVQVMSTTLAVSSMVFAIFVGAQLLALVFRGLGGDEYVGAFLNALPGGFWGMFAVVMLLIFVLGFFLDFIEITLIVIPIIAPIILSHPDVSVSAVWLAIMIAINLQTSFLTPPFGFALFYLRGIAAKTAPSVTTGDIYRGVVPFIGIQLLVLVLLCLIPAITEVRLGLPLFLLFIFTPLFVGIAFVAFRRSRARVSAS